MTLLEYYDALAAFDWDYARSDDHGVYTRGHTRLNELRAMAGEDKAKQRLWLSWFKFSSGQTLNKPRRPK